MDKQKIKNDFMKVLSDHDYEYDTYAVSDIVEKSLEKKEHLIEMFRKHEKWDEDQLCIHFDRDFERKTDSGAVTKFINWLWRNVKDQIEKPAVKAEVDKLLAQGVDSWNISIDSDKYNPLRTIIHEYTIEESRWGGGVNVYDALSAIPYETILPEFDDDNYPYYRKYLGYLNDLDEKFNFRPGMKLNRVFNKICIKLGLDKLEGYNAAFAQFSDGITPLKISRHTTISVNPVDFLLMSNGNSWRSCHYIGDDPSDAGCYSSGTISYMLGEDSFIVSIIDKEWPNDNLAMAPKINRQVFGYRDGKLLQSRLYPQDCDHGASDEYRNLREMVEEIIAKAEDTSNRWVRDDDMQVWHGGTAYDDWWHFSNCKQYSLRDYMMDADARKRSCIRMDNEPICIKCGERHSYEESILCEECGTDAYCSDCGCHIDLSDEGSYFQYDGYYYCTDCRFWCSKCDQPERRRYEIYISDIEESWCEECASYYAFYCDDCNEYYSTRHTERYETVDGETICENCFEDDYILCEDCDRAVRFDDAVRINDCYYCEECAEKHREEESA